MALHKLTETKLKRITDDGLHSDGGNLHFRVTGKARSWVFRYTLRGKTRDAGLGPWPDRSLEDARAKAAEARKLLLDHIDPIEHWRGSRGAAVAVAAKGTLTFDQCVDRYVDAHAAEWGPVHRHQWPQTLRMHVCPTLGKLPVHLIDTTLVVRSLEKVWSESPVTAARIRGRIEKVLDWAKTAGLRSGENPARWKGHLDHLLSNPRKTRVVERHKAMAHTDVAAFMVKLRERKDLPSKALELAIVCGLRSSEVLKAEWSEIGMANRIWTVPASHMQQRGKGGRTEPHKVPLSDAAMAVLKYCDSIRHSNHVFPGQRAGKPLSETVMRQVLKQMGLKKTVDVHGFRSSLSTWRAEMTNFPEEVGEAVLAHAKGDPVAAAYNRSDYIGKKRQLLDAWARYIGKPVTATGGKVVNLRRA
jgi:integrase